jgi:hypothetical protein
MKNYFCRLEVFKKQILAYISVKNFPFGIFSHMCFFSDVGLLDQCPQNSKHYPGIEHSTFGVAVGDDNLCDIQVTVEI